MQKRSDKFFGVKRKLYDHGDDVAIADLWNRFMDSVGNKDKKIYYVINGDKVALRKLLFFWMSEYSMRPFDLFKAAKRGYFKTAKRGYFKTDYKFVRCDGICLDSSFRPVGWIDYDALTKWVIQNNIELPR